MQKNFTAQQFKATKFETAQAKATFANHFIRFVLSGFKITIFPHWFYQRLSMCFGHIAHYNRDGFYSTWVSGTERQREFFRNILNYPCYGDPEYTYSDVEKELKAYVQREGLFEKYRALAAKEDVEKELGELSMLMRKYPRQAKAFNVLL